MEKQQPIKTMNPLEANEANEANEELIKPEKIDGRSKPRTEKQKLQFLKLQAIRQERALKSRMDKNEKIKEMILKQLDIEKRNKSANNRKIKKISNSILDDEFKQDDKEILKNILLNIFILFILFIISK